MQHSRVAEASGLPQAAPGGRRAWSGWSRVIRRREAGRLGLRVPVGGVHQVAELALPARAGCRRDPSWHEALDGHRRPPDHTHASRRLFPLGRTGQSGRSSRGGLVCEGARAANLCSSLSAAIAPTSLKGEIADPAREVVGAEDGGLWTVTPRQRETQVPEPGIGPSRRGRTQRLHGWRREGRRVYRRSRR